MTEGLKRVLLLADVNDQRLKIKKVKNFDNLIEKSQNFVCISFAFSEVWKSAGIEKIICQFRGEDGVFDVSVEDDVCDVPWEVLAKSGYVEVCVYAVGENNTVITTGSDSFKVEGGAYKDGAQTSEEATPTIYSQLVEDVLELKTQTAADVEMLKKQMSEDLEELKLKTSSILTSGKSVQSEDVFDIAASEEIFMGVSEGDMSVAEKWENISAGIRFTNEGIEIKSGNSHILLNGDEINLTAGGNGISIGCNGTKFVGTSPYIGMTDMVAEGIVSGIVGVSEELGEDE